MRGLRHGRSAEAGEARRSLLLGDSAGAEIELLLFKNRRKIGIEIKYTDAPTMTPSIRNALADLQRDRLVVVYPGEREYSLDDRVRVMPMAHLAGNRPSLFSVARSHG